MLDSGKKLFDGRLEDIIISNSESFLLEGGEGSVLGGVDTDQLEADVGSSNVTQQCVPFHFRHINKISFLLINVIIKDRSFWWDLEMMGRKNVE